MLILLISDAPGSSGSSQELEQCQATTASVSFILGHMVYHLCYRSAWFLSDGSPDSLPFICLHVVPHSGPPQNGGLSPQVCINF